MSESATVSEVDQCIALTASGERCTRPARDGAFCYQHDDESQTLDDADDVEADSVEEALEERDELPEDEAAENSSDDDADVPPIEGSIDLPELRSSVNETADAIIGRPLDGIVSIDRNDDGWVVRVDCLERKSVPDTQDILGQYEIEFSDDGTVRGYRRRHRYRRGDTGSDDASGVAHNSN